MNLFEKTKYTIRFILVSDACTWQAIKIEENFQKSPRPTPGPGPYVRLQHLDQLLGEDGEDGDHRGDQNCE